jgi:signal peptidase I
MNLDFALILTVLTLVTAVFWGIERYWRKRRQGGDAEQPVAKTVEMVGSLFPVLLLVLVFRSFLFEPFKIPSGSMIPTLWIGDFIVVNKYAYGLRLPVGNHRFLEVGDPERGDVAVFRYPVDPRINYIKRVIGLPGDTVTYRNKILFINGEPVTQDNVAPWVGEGLNRNPPGRRPVKRLEYLGEEPHNIVIYPEQPDLETRTWTVPDGHYFVLGDNRDQSLDSRAWGFVSEDLLVGRAVRIWMHWDCSRGCVDWSRIGDRIL